jgi:hypothetical protein
VSRVSRSVEALVVNAPVVAITLAARAVVI